MIACGSWMYTRRLRGRALAVLCLCACAATAWARPDPIVVTASVAPSRLSALPGAVTVVRVDETVVFQNRDAGELLRQVPGLHVDSMGGRGGIGSVYLRGGDPNYTLVLIDGVKMNDPTDSRGGAYDLASVDIGVIERIEIVRGPFSAVHGSGALNGAVNIITRRGSEEPVRSVTFSAGRYDAYDVALRCAGLAGPADYALSGSWRQEGETASENRFEGVAFHGNVGIAFSDTMALRTIVRYLDSFEASFPEDSGGPDFAVLREPEDRDVQEAGIALSFVHTPARRWEYLLRVSYHERTEDLDSPGVAPGVRDPFGIAAWTAETSYRPCRFEMRHLLRLGATRLSAGAEALLETAESDGSLLAGGPPIPTGYDMDRTLVAPFLELQLGLGPLAQVHAGVRADIPEDEDVEWSPRAGISCRLPGLTNTLLHASWGEGFKLPSFFALGHPIVGNPELRAERTEGADLGVRQSFLGGAGRVDITYFANSAEDGIDFEEGPPPRLVNRSEIRADGVEATLTVAPSRRVSVGAHLTYTRTDIVGTDEELRNRPEWRGGVSCRWRPSRDVLLTARGLYVGESLDSSIPTGDVTLDDYVRFDLGGQWQVRKGLLMFAAVDNVFDARYEEYVGFPAAGIAPRIGLRAAF